MDDVSQHQIDTHVIVVAKNKNTTITFLGFGLASINIANGVTDGGNFDQNALSRFWMVCHVTERSQFSDLLPVQRNIGF